MQQPIKHYSFHEKVKQMTYAEFKKEFSGIYPADFLEQAAREMKLKGIGKVKTEDLVPDATGGGEKLGE